MRRIFALGGGLAAIFTAQGVLLAGPAPATPKNADAYTVTNTTGKTANDLVLTYDKAPVRGTSHTFTNDRPGTPGANDITFDGANVPNGTLDYGTVAFAKAPAGKLKAAAWSFPVGANIPIKLALLDVNPYQLNGEAYVTLTNNDPTDSISVTNFQATPNIPDSNVVVDGSNNVDTGVLTSEPTDSAGVSEMDQQFGSPQFFTSQTMIPLESLTFDLGPASSSTVTDIAATLDATDTTTGATEGIGAISNANTVPEPACLGLLGSGGLALLQRRRRA